jgi:hypothetical protein
VLDRFRSKIGSLTGPSSQVMSFSGEEPCEECGATPADDLVGVRWLCGACAPAARRAEREDAGAPEGPGVDR